jgi:hypothetical protein
VERGFKELEGVAHQYRAVHDDVARVEGGAVSGQRNAGCGGWSGRTGAPGLGDVRGRVVRAGGTAGGNGTSGCLR